MAIFNYLFKIKSPDTASRFLLTCTNMKAFTLKAVFLSTLNLSEMVTPNYKQTLIF